MTPHYYFHCFFIITITVTFVLENLSFDSLFLFHLPPQSGGPFFHLPLSFFCCPFFSSLFTSLHWGVIFISLWITPSPTHSDLKSLFGQKNEADHRLRFYELCHLSPLSADPRVLVHWEVQCPCLKVNTLLFRVSWGQNMKAQWRHRSQWHTIPAASVCD